MSNTPITAAPARSNAPATGRAARVIRSQDFTLLPSPPNAPFLRRQGFDDGHVWMGEVTTESGAASPWHHHGEYDTFVYCLEGQGRLEFADDGLAPVEFRADGSLVLIPKGLVHREINTGSERNRALVIRVGSGPSVVPVDLPPKA